MMLRNHGWLPIVTLAVIGILGCGKSEGPVQQSAGSPDRNVQSTASSNMPGNQATDTPEAACREFLEAMRTGNDEKAAQMLSEVAREKAAALGRSVMPIGQRYCPICRRKSQICRRRRGPSRIDLD